MAGPQSGDLASYGIPSARAAELVVREVNAKGGVLGRQVKLLVEDDVCKPEIAANTAGKLVSDKADVVLGHICSGAAKAALGIYRDAGVIAMSPSATNPELTQSGQYPNFYRTIAPDDAQARIEVDFALDTLKVKKIAVLHDKQDYGRGLAEFARKFIEASGGRGQVVLFEGITPGAVDYSAVIQKIRQSGAEAVIYGGYHPEASKLVSGMRKKKIDLPFISDDGVKDDTFIKVAGAFAEGVYASGPRDTSTNPLAIKAVAAHRAAFGGDPGAFYLNAWAATQALLNAIAKAGTHGFGRRREGAAQRVRRDAPREDPLRRARGRRGRRLRDVPRPEGRLRRGEVAAPGRGSSSSHGLFPRAVRQRPDPRQHLRPDRAGLHDGLRDPGADQLRPRRDLHDRRLHRADRGDAALLDRAAAARGAAARGRRRRGLGRGVGPRGRARRLPPAARRAAAGAADQRDRDVDPAAELRADRADLRLRLLPRPDPGDPVAGAATPRSSAPPRS